MRRLMIIAAFLMPLLASGNPVPAKAADVGISLRIGDRYRGDRLYFQQRPRFVMVPGTRVRYIEDSDMDVYQYGDAYFAFDNGRWFRSYSYNGPWIFVSARSVPRQIFYVPTDYRRNWRGNYGYWRHRDWDRSYDRGDRDYRDRDYRDRDNRDRYRDRDNRDRYRDNGGY